MWINADFFTLRDLSSFINEFEMTINNTFRYEKITPKQWKRITQELQQRFSLIIDSYKGCANSQGFCFEWEYCPCSCELQICCITKPAFLSLELVQFQIEALIHNCKKEKM